MAAWNAVEAVSLSLISPIITISGSCLKIDLKPEAKKAKTQAQQLAELEAWKAEREAADLSEQEKLQAALAKAEAKATAAEEQLAAQQRENVLTLELTKRLAGKADKEQRHLRREYAAVLAESDPWETVEELNEILDGVDKDYAEFLETVKTGSGQPGQHYGGGQLNKPPTKAEDDKKYYDPKYLQEVARRLGRGKKEK